MDILPGGSFIANGVSLRSLLKKAYGLRDFQIEGSPSWFDSQRYDVSAKAAGPVDVQQVNLMLRALLVDRFKLKFRRESRELQAYVLTIARNGPRLKEAVKEDDSSGGVRMRGVGHLAGIKASVGQLAEMLSDVALNGRYILDRPVLDRTGLSAVYDFTLEWTPDLTPTDTAPTASSGPSIFTAVQEQLGLKLELRKAPVEIFIIDHVERASDN